MLFENDSVAHIPELSEWVPATCGDYMQRALVSAAV